MAASAIALVSLSIAERVCRVARPPPHGTISRHLLARAIRVGRQSSCLALEELVAHETRHEQASAVTRQAWRGRSIESTTVERYGVQDH
jgi:hypothetical protein